MFQDCLNGPERNMFSIHHECPGITDGGPIMAISQWRDRPDYQVALKRRSVPSGKRYYQGTDPGCCDREEKKLCGTVCADALARFSIPFPLDP